MSDGRLNGMTEKEGQLKCRISKIEEARRPAFRGMFRKFPSFWAALAGAFCFGIICHGMALFNKFSWHDDIFSLFMTGTAIPLGRWMLHVLAEAERWFYGNGYFSLPVFNGVLSLLCIGCASGMLTTYFQIRSKVLSVLLGVVMVAFPVVTSLLGFMYTIHFYMISLLMITGGGILICRDGTWWQKVIGVLLCGCAVGVYQAFIPVLLMLVLLDQIRFLLLQEADLRQWGKRLLIQAVCVAGVMGVYWAGNQLFLQLKHLELDGYLGISEMGETSLAAYWQGAATAYREFFQPSHGTLWDMYPQAMYNVYRLMICLNLGMSILWFVRIWKKSRLRALLFMVMMALIPLGCNFIFVMTGEVHSLMVYGQVMHFLLTACLADWMEGSFSSPYHLFSRGVVLLLAVSGIMYFRYDNQCYLKTQLQQQEAISWNTTLVTRIESIDGYRDELPVAFVNRRGMQDRNLYNPDELDFLSLGTYDVNMQDYLNDWAWESFLNRWCGFGPEMVKEEQVTDWPEVQAMPSYPDDGSIRIIQDTIVVKF